MTGIPLFLNSHLGKKTHFFPFDRGLLRRPRRNHPTTVSPQILLFKEKNASENSANKCFEHIQMEVRKTQIITPPKTPLFGGFNPFEKYLSNCIISPGRGESKHAWFHHRRLVDFSPFNTTARWKLHIWWNDWGSNLDNVEARGKSSAPGVPKFSSWTKGWLETHGKIGNGNRMTCNWLLVGGFNHLKHITNITVVELGHLPRWGVKMKIFETTT